MTWLLKSEVYEFETRMSKGSLKYSVVLNISNGIYIIPRWSILYFLRLLCRDINILLIFILIFTIFILKLLFIYLLFILKLNIIQILTHWDNLRLRKLLQIFPKFWFAVIRQNKIHFHFKLTNFLQQIFFNYII